MNVTPNMIAFINICKSYKKEAYEQAAYIIKEVEEDTNG